MSTLRKNVTKSVLFLAAALPGLATQISGGSLVNGIVFSDTATVQGPSDWFFANTVFGTGPGQVAGFIGAADLTSLQNLIAQEYIQITSFTSLTFQGGQVGFSAASLAKLTNLQKFDFITTLQFLDPFDVPGDDVLANLDLTVQPEVGNGFGPFTLIAPVETSAAPEPATVTMMVATMGMLLAFGFIRRRSITAKY